MNIPFFSIIIPTYNRSKLISETIQSVLNQSFDDFELIIIDDGSTDNTSEVVAQFDDKRISYYIKKNEERGAARNYGGKKSKGKYVTFLDSDDLFYKNHLIVAKRYILENKNPKIFFQQYEQISSEGISKIPYQPKNSIINNELVRKGNFMSCHGVFLKREMFLDNLFNEDRDLAGSEDYELWLRIASKFPIYYSATITNALKDHAGRSVVTMDTHKIIERKKRMLAYLFENNSFVERYGHLKSNIESDANSYIALHLSLNKERIESLKYLLKAIFNYPLSIFKKRTLIIVIRFFRF